ncbi:MAG: NAD(P)/FAD-dependent oxidoreductase [Bacteroidia bacterium]|nr:NAD(P)/FAD-dependent oxidoreductase [Bacteroidia bacterium]
MKISKEDPIIIIGSGIAGVSAALALRYAGFSNITLYEKNADITVPEVPVSCGPNLLLSLRELNLTPLLQQSSVPWQQMNIRTKDNKIVKDFDFSKIVNDSGYKPFSISLTELYQVFREKLPDEMFVCGEEFISFTQNEKEVEAHFASGKSVKGALLMGADGFRSRVRLQLKGDSEVRSLQTVSLGCLVAKSAFSQPDHEIFTQPCLTFVSRDGKICVRPVNENQIGISITLPGSAETLSLEKAREVITATFGEWAEPLAEAAKLAADSPLFMWEQKDREPDSGWFVDRVLLLGDAVHPSFSFMGMGVDMVVESNLLLAKLLGENLRRAERGFKAWEKQRKKRTRLFNKFAYRNAKMFSIDGAVAATLRDMTYEYLPDIYTENPLYEIMNGSYLS